MNHAQNTTQDLSRCVSLTDTIPSAFIEKMLWVSVGVLTDKQSQVLLTYRPETLPQGGFWEFPGGKIYAGETPYEALVREIEEELNLQVTQASPLTKVYYVYKKTKVILDCWFVEAYCGKLIAKEEQRIKWVSLKDIEPLEFSRPNRLVLSTAKKAVERKG